MASLRKNKFNIYLNDDKDAFDLLDFLLPEPDRIIGSGESLVTEWTAGHTQKGFFSFNGNSFFYKKYLPKDRLYGAKNIFRISRALQAWHYAKVFHQKAVPTVQPVIVMDKRIYGFLGPSYIIFPRLKGFENLWSLWGKINEKQKLDCMQELGKIIGEMHHEGLLHGDLNWRNILISFDNDSIHALIIDLDGCSHRRGFNRDRALKDLNHFYRDLDRCSASEKHLQEFTRLWNLSIAQ